MNEARYQAERSLLERKVPANAFRFFYEGIDKPYLRIGAKTNCGNVYTLHIELSKFPADVPKVFVTRMLEDKDSNKLSEPDASMHTLRSEHGWTRICHYGTESWTPNVTLYKIYIKSRLWLEMYEAHLRSGRPIDYYLSPQD